MILECARAKRACTMKWREMTSSWPWRVEISARKSGKSIDAFSIITKNTVSRIYAVNIPHTFGDYNGNSWRWGEGGGRTVFHFTPVFIFSSGRVKSRLQRGIVKQISVKTQLLGRNIRWNTNFCSILKIKKIEKLCLAWCFLRNQILQIHLFSAIPNPKFAFFQFEKSIN